MHRPWIPALALSLLAVSAQAEGMPVTQQNALVHKYCAVCHTDAASNGGLSLEHFDAATAVPSLMAMLLSKLTSGVSLATVREAPTTPAAAALVNQKMKAGAMSAAGIPIPDKPTIDALIQALSTRSAGAMEWSLQRTKAPGIEASILREVSFGATAGEARFYRLIVSCSAVSQQGSMQLAWSPTPQTGKLALSADGGSAASYTVEGSEKMGNGGSFVLHGLAAIKFPSLPLPAESLTITDLFPGETVVFPFASLPQNARHEFQACFPGAAQAKR